MSWRIRLALVLEAAAFAVTLWCLIVTTALSMTAFFVLGLPLFGAAAMIYLWEVFLDLRRHRVL